MGNVSGLEILIDIAPSKRREFLLTAEDLLGGARILDDACVDSRIFERHGVPNQFLWQEEWKDRESLQSRLDSVAFRTLLGALRVLGTAHDVRIINAEELTRLETA